MIANMFVKAFWGVVIGIATCTLLYAGLKLFLVLVS